MSGKISRQSSRRPQSVPGQAPPHPSGAQLTVTLKLRAPGLSPQAARRCRGLLEKTPNNRRYLTREEHAKFFCARPDDFARVEKFAHAHDLTVVHAEPRARTLSLRGTTKNIERAFRVRLKSVADDAGIFPAPATAAALPQEISPLVVAIFGLDARTAVPKPRGSRALAVAGGDSGGMDPEFIASAYGFAPDGAGAGQCIGIIQLNTTNLAGEMGTGYRASDLEQFFAQRKIATPVVTAVGIGGGGNFPGVTEWSDREAALDLQIAAALAPQAKFVVYFAPNNERGFHDALAGAIHDSVRNPRIISVSWGDVEDNYSDDFKREVNALLEEAATLGITVCVSAGDLGSAGLPEDADDGKPHAFFPASSPFALTVGGTSAKFSGDKIIEEKVWNGGYRLGATGGGFSKVFPMPAWQAAALAKFPGAGRGLPDLGGHADPAFGYNIVLSGQGTTAAGTSAVAPFVAGLLARINARRATAGRGPMGNINSLLYAHPGAFRNINLGSNDISAKLGRYTAASGWNPCTGLGVPLGEALAALLN